MTSGVQDLVLAFVFDGLIRQAAHSLVIGVVRFKLNARSVQYEFVFFSRNDILVSDKCAFSKFLMDKSVNGIQSLNKNPIFRKYK